MDPLRRPRQAIAAPPAGPYHRALLSHERGEMGDGGLEAVLLGNRAALLRFLRARGGAADADDLFQELWLKLSQAPAPGPIGDPLAYLYKAADNMMHDSRRAATRRVTREAAWTDAGRGASPDASEAPSADRVLGARDELARVQTALDGLGERTAAIFRRFRVDGAGQKHIAAEQGISLSAVEKHLQRAYRAIMAIRAEEVDAGPPDRRRPDDEEPVNANR